MMVLIIATQRIAHILYSTLLKYSTRNIFRLTPSERKRKWLKRAAYTVMIFFLSGSAFLFFPSADATIKKLFFNHPIINMHISISYHIIIISCFFSFTQRRKKNLRLFSIFFSLFYSDPTLSLSGKILEWWLCCDFVIFIRSVNKTHIIISPFFVLRSVYKNKLLWCCKKMDEGEII